MSQNKDDKGPGSRPTPDAGLPKRPVPTIDLKATEVKAETKPVASSPGASQTGAKPAEAKPGSVVPNVEAKGAAKPGTPVTDDKKPDAGKPSVSSTPGATWSPTGPTKPVATSSPFAQPAAAKTGEVGKPASSVKGAPPAPAPVAPPASARTGSGIGRALSYLSAAVLGGLLAIFGADFVAGTLGIEVRTPGPAVSAVEGLSTRLSKLETSVSQAPASRSDPAPLKAVTDQLAQATERLAKLEGANRQLGALGEAQAQLAATTRALEDKIGKEALAAAPDASGRIAKLEETIQALVSTAQSQPGRPLPEVARLSTKLQELEAAVAALRKGGGGAEAMAQIEARLAEARKGEAQMSEAVARLKEDGTSRLREIEAVKTQTERLEGRVEAIKSDAGTARTSVDTLKSDVTAQLQTVARQGDLKSTLEVVDKRVAGLEQRVDTMSKRDDELQANAARIVVSLQLANLKRDMEQGKPFDEQLAAVEKAAGGTLDLAPLKAYRKQGVPTTTDLATQFRTLTRTVLDAEQTKAQATTVDRLLQSAKSVVQIRRVGADVKGDTAEATLARAEHNLKTGDLETAAREMKSLKPELRGTIQAWLDQLEARVAVDRGLKAIEDKLKTSIAGAQTDSKAAAGKDGK